MLKIFFKVLLMVIPLFFLTLKNAPIIKAETILFEDDFSGGFEKWESVRNNFDLWSIVDNQADVFINKSSTLAELVPKDLYWNPEWKNIVYELDYNYIQGADKNISFGFKDVLNWYEIHFIGNSYILSHVKDGRVSWDNSGYVSLTNNIFHHISINLNEGSIIVLLDNEEIINVIDPTFDNDYGKIGIKAGAGSIYPTHAIYDNIIVKSLDNLINMLDVSPLKQTDPSWANQEYDTAQNWSSEYGIERWGCLITSISMVMNYHGINNMPNGDAVSPASINSWLNSQPDGYVGSGLVNWMAISRLTNLISATHSTPKLEYRRVPGDDLTIATNEIGAGKPVMLQIPGHFMVGNGIVENEIDQNEIDDLYISDPAYNYEKFSEHQKTLLSTRILEPTFTDLSYIHLSHGKNIYVEIKKDDTSEISNLQSFEEYIGDFYADENSAGGGFSQNNSPTTKIHEIEKPENGNYIIELFQDNFGPVDLVIFAYNKEGELSNLSYSGLVGQNKIKLNLVYDSDGNSSIEKIINFETLFNDINELYQQREIKKHYVATELKKFAEFGKESSGQNQLRYVMALKQLVEWHSPQITETGKLYLNQRLEEIEGIIGG